MQFFMLIIFFIFFLSWWNLLNSIQSEIVFKLMNKNDNFMIFDVSSWNLFQTFFIDQVFKVLIDLIHEILQNLWHIEKNFILKICILAFDNLVTFRMKIWIFCLPSYSERHRSWKERWRGANNLDIYNSKFFLPPFL